MQGHYNLSAEDIWSMSWRRFSTLFFKLFSWAGDAETEGSLPERYGSGGSRRSHYERAVHEAAGADARISRSFDWDSAFGREPAVSRDILTTEELLGKTHRTET